MQKKHLFLFLLLMSSFPLYAQMQSDTTDVFYNHVVEGEAVVTGLTGRTRQKDSPAPILLVSANELKQATGSNIVDILSRQPGLSQVSTGTGIGKPIIRGLGYNRVVSLNDGVRQEGQQWGDEHGLEVDGSSIHSVEVLKGPASLMYGSDAMAGVVIFHAAPVRAEGEMGGSAQAEFQSNSGLWNYALRFDGNKRGWVWNTSWSQKRSHAYKNKFDGYVPGTQQSEYAARAMMGLHKEWGHTYLVWSTYSLIPSISEGERDETTGLLTAPVGWTGKSYGKSLPFQRVRHHKVISDNSFRLSRGTLNVVLGYQQNRRQEFEDNVSASELFLLLHTFTYDLRFLSAEFGGWKLTAGANGMYQRSLNKGEDYLIPDYRLFDFGTYLTGSRRWGNVLFSGGIRYDRRHLHSEGLANEEGVRFENFTRQFHGVTGSVGAVWNVRNNLNLRFNLARGYRAPSISELGVNGVHEGTLRYELGRSTLRPEYSLQADLGLDFTNRYLSLQAAVFINRISHYIYAARTGAEADGYAVYQYVQGNARLCGLELGLDYHPIHSVHLLNTFSYVNAVQPHQPRETKYLPLTPAPRWTAEVKWEIVHNKAQLGPSCLALANAYLSANMACHLRQNHYYRADHTETATPSYTLFGLSAGTAVLWRERRVVEVCLTVDNLFDRAYQDHLSRLKYAAVNPLTHRLGIFNPGRNISLRLILPF